MKYPFYTRISYPNQIYSYKMSTPLEQAFTNAFQAFVASKKTAEEEVSFYTSKAYQLYYDYHFRSNYKSYKHYSLEDLDEEEEVMKASRLELCQALRQKKNLELLDYQLCCELDAELDAIYAAYRRRTRYNSM